MPIKNINNTKAIRDNIDTLLQGYSDEDKLKLIYKVEAYIGEKKALLVKEQKKPGIKHPRNVLNELNGNEWSFFTKTVLNTSFPSELRHNLRKEHYANKPPRLMKHLIEFCTINGENILDPFAGVGGTLFGTSLCGRKSTGIEINQKWIDIYKEICNLEQIELQQMIHGDCIAVMTQMKDSGTSFDAIITDPPYSPALEKSMCDGRYGRANRRSNFDTFSADPKDFRNSSTFNEYYERMEQAGRLMYSLLKPKRYLMVMIRDSYQGSEYIPASFYVGERLKLAGFTLKGIKIWYQTGAPVRPYGYPYSYVPNIVHHNILILRK